MKTKILAKKDCPKCGGRSRCQMLIGGVAVCDCVLDQIDIRNSEGQTTHLKISDDKSEWILTFGDEPQ